MSTIPEYSNQSDTEVGVSTPGQGAMSRLLKCSVPAAIITTGLFLGMQALVQAEGYTAPEIEARVILPFIAEPETPLKIAERRPVDKPSPVSPPPAAPPLTNVISDIDLPLIKIKGAAPDTAQIGRMKPMQLPVTGLGNRDTLPIRPPVVTYPPIAEKKGIQGSCDVRMDVTPKGRPYNIMATCTSHLFVKEAERAVSKVEFLPKITNGQAAGRENVIYPLEFKLEQ